MKYYMLQLGSLQKNFTVEFTLKKETDIKKIKKIKLIINT